MVSVTEEGITITADTIIITMVIVGPIIMDKITEEVVITGIEEMDTGITTITIIGIDKCKKCNKLRTTKIIRRKKLKMMLIWIIINNSSSNRAISQW